MSDWHKDVPREVRANADFRKKLLLQCRGSAAYRKAVLEVCAKDVLFWVNAFVWQHNPNAIGAGSLKFGPFLTWDFQEEAVRAIESAIDNRDDLLIQKSREMGASWLCLLIMLRRFLFLDGQQFLLISRSEQAVDRRGDPNSLFWKLEFVIERLPDWMTEGRVRRLKLSYENRLLLSSITGQASTGKAGVGSRATAMFIDEFSQIDEDFEVYQRTSDTTGCRIFNGTHTGPETAFAKLATDKLVRCKKLFMHWTQHPDKRRGLYRWDQKNNRVEQLDPGYPYPPDYPFVEVAAPTGGPYPGLRSPWYDEQCARKMGNTRAVAMDLDIDLHGSTSLFFDVLMLQRCIEDCTDPWWEGEVGYDPETGEPEGLTKKPGGLLKLWCHLQPDGSPEPGDYVMGGDVSWGSGATPSCFSVVNRKTGEKVGEYANATVEPRRLAGMIVALCKTFRGEEGPARLIWEQQGPGVTFGNRVVELGFLRIYFRTAEMPVTMDVKVSERPGWVPTPETNTALLADYANALALGHFVNRSEASLKECLAFKHDGRGGVRHAESESKNDPAGARLNHSDRVIADALAWKLAKGGRARPKPRADNGPPVLSLAWRRQLAHNESQEQAW